MGCLLALGAGCSEAPRAVECGNDEDCSNGRVCVASACVSPTGDGSPAVDMLLDQGVADRGAGPGDMGEMRLDQGEMDMRLDRDSALLDLGDIDMQIDHGVDAMSIDYGPLPMLESETLVAIAASIAPETPLLFVGRPELEDGTPPRLTLELQPLSVESFEPVGDPISATAPLDASRAFELDFGRVSLDGATNPVSPGAELEMDLLLIGRLLDPLPCGTGAGQVIQPLNLPLEGTWGSAPLGQGAISNVEPVTACD